MEGSAATSAPFVLVLGTAQDGGLPQLACQEELCRSARENPERRRRVASLLIVDPRSQERWLIDATPDFPEQVELADTVAPRSPGQGRPPLFDGIFLTHAHFGHYTGLGYLGREVYGSQPTRVWGSRRMVEFLSGNGPWDLLVKEQHVELGTLAPGQAVELAPDLRVRAFTVPHRDEYTDTLGFWVEGPSRRLLYIPDIDKWEAFDEVSGSSIEELIARSDYALLDGSFFGDGEIPGRPMAQIPHPFIAESLDRFALLSAAERAKVLFTHLNHTNPASDPESAAAAHIQAQGCAVAGDGQRLSL